jgi:hypothetical protein
MESVLLGDLHAGDYVGGTLIVRPAERTSDNKAGFRLRPPAATSDPTGLAQVEPGSRGCRLDEISTWGQRDLGRFGNR